MSCDDASSPSTPPAGEITGIHVSLSPATMPYVPTSLVVTAVDANGTTVTAAEGSVVLSLEGGRINLNEVNLEKGRLESEIRIEAPVTQVVRTATFGEFTTQTTVDLNPIQPVPGDAKSSASQALPSLPFFPRVEVSINTVTVVLDKDVSIENVNTILERYQAGVVAFSPGKGGL